LPKLEAKKDVKKGGVQSRKFSFLKGISVIVCEQFYPCSHLGLANQEEHLRHGCVSAMKIPPFPPWKIETDLHRDHPNVDFGRRAPLVELVPSKTSKIIVLSQPKNIQAIKNMASFNPRFAHVSHLSEQLSWDLGGYLQGQEGLK